MDRKESSSSEIDTFIVQSLIALSQKIRFMQRRQAAEQGLAPLQLSIIQFLSESGMAPVYPASLAKALDISRPTLSAAIQTLSKKKLILISRDSSDGRKYTLQLTERGRNAAPISRLYVMPLEQIIARIPLSQKRNLLQQVSGIQLKLEEILS